MTWTQSGNIKGASGVPGASGASGSPGASGVPGATGPMGASGASGGTGGTGGPGTTTWADITDKPGAILNYKGTWNASTNSPSLSDSTGSGGDVYRVSVGGSRNLGSGTISWEVGDYAIWSPVTYSWEKADTTDAVSSVAGRTGAVTLTSADLGASGTASSSTFLRGDNTWASGPIGATGATGASGGTGGTGAPGSNYSRVITTITSPTTLGASGSTDYVTFLSGANSSVLLLLHGNGTNGSTTITDSSISARTITRTGATISTTQSKFGGASIYFNGSSVISTTSSDFAFGTSTDFTCEAWVYPTSLSSYNAMMGTRQTSGNDGNGFSFMIVSDGSVLFYSNAFDVQSSAGAVVTNSWQHVAAVRSGTTVKLYVGGVEKASGTFNKNMSNTTFSVGAYVGEFTQPFTGYIDEVRVTPSAVYTAGFTAPTVAFADPSTGAPTLPAASGALGRYSFRNISGATIIVGASGTQRINGATGGLSLANGASTELMSDGSGWYSF